MQKQEFATDYIHRVKCRSTNEYDYYTIGWIRDTRTDNFVEATLKVPKGARDIHFKVTYQI